MKQFFKYNFLLIICVAKIQAQTTFPSNGAPFNSHSVYAFINATIYTDFETVLKNGILLVQDGKVIDAGEKIALPENAIIVDVKGKFIYPSFIDIYSDYGLSAIKQERKESRGPQMESSVKGAYGWNQRGPSGSGEGFRHTAPGPGVYGCPD